jgi:ribonuclease P protein component
MLKKKERLTRTEFDRSFSSGKRTHTPYFQIISSPSDSFHGSVVVGKKVYKKAVDRNRLRRQLYSVLYHFHKNNASTKTYILITKPTITSIPHRAVTDILRETLEKI